MYKILLNEKSSVGIILYNVKNSLEEEQKILKASEKNQTFYRGISAAPGNIVLSLAFLVRPVRPVINYDLKAFLWWLSGFNLLIKWLNYNYLDRSYEKFK